MSLLFEKSIPERPLGVEDQGSASSNATVTVNATAAYQKGNYYRSELAVDNSTLPVYLPIMNLGTLDTNSVFINRHTLLAKTPEAFGYDADGNLTNDGKWSYTWDGENRLVALQSLSAIPDAAKRRMEYAYDEQGRRIYAKIMEWNTNSSSYQIITEERYWYDGWNIIGRADLATTLVQNFVWGLDLSGTMQGAGGVGGLLILNDSTGASYFYNYDGNGNVLALINANDGTTVAQYDYDPFLGVIRADGLMAKANPFLGSTKFYDWDTEFYNYGHRIYKPATGTWPNRDPLEENGGLNLNGFASNDGINAIDPLGLSISIPCNIDEILNNNSVSDFSKDSDAYGTTYSGNAKYNIANLNSEILGTMIKSSRLFKFKDKSDLAKHIRARVKTTQYAVGMRTSFATHSDGQLFPSSGWSPNEGPNGDILWTLKPGLSRNEQEAALRELQNERYQIACFDAAKSAVIAGAVFAGGSAYDPILDPTGISPDDWIPGDWGHITSVVSH
jgi:RHS repeat-associated protein